MAVYNLHIVKEDVFGIFQLCTFFTYEQGVFQLQIVERHLGQTIEIDGTPGSLACDVRDKQVAEELNGKKSAINERLAYLKTL